MALEMKGTCERCQTQLEPQGEAYVCSFECTFCPACAMALDGICPNCGGELVRRPRRKSNSTAGSLGDDPVEPASAMTGCRIAD